MGRALRTMLLLLTLPVLLGGCGSLPKWFTKKARHNKDAETNDVQVGIIEMVNPEQGFVLVKTSTEYNLQAGRKLETRPLAGIRSVLTVSPEQKLNFLTADITEGLPQKGEIVVLPPQVGSLMAPATTVPSPQSETSPSTLPPPIL